MSPLFKFAALLVAFLLMTVISHHAYAKERFMSPNTSNASSSANSPILVIKTNKGDIKVRLLCDVAPKACENFLQLADEKFYEGVTFHRVIKNFMIQGGDPTGSGSGGQSIWGRPFADEFSAQWVFDKPGLLAMANSGPNTNSSQFFITTVPTPWLNKKHTIFGVVIDGFPVVQAIENVPANANGRPLEPVRIERINRIDDSGKK